MTVKKICLLLLFTISCCILFAQKIVLTDAKELRLIGKWVTYFEDTTEKLTVADIQRADIQAKFKPSGKDVFTAHAFTKAVWFKIVLQNLTAEDVWLETGGPYACWYIDFYRPDSAGFYHQPVMTGAMRPEKNKEYPVNFYWLQLAKANNTGVRTYYLRMLSGRTPEYPLQAGTLLALHSNKVWSDYLTAGFVGLMLIMLFYNFFLFTATRDRLYFIYTTYLAAGLVALTFINNYPLFPGVYWFWTNMIGWQGLGFLLVSIFSIYYLKLKEKSPKFYLVVVIETVILCIVMPVLNLSGVPVKELIPFNQPMIAVFSLTMLLAGFHLHYRGLANARYYAAGWSMASLAIIIFIFVLRGQFPFNLFTRYIAYFGITLEVIMFSFALGERLNILRKENSKVQAENIRLVKEQNLVLEQKIEERTRQLKEQSASLQQVNDTKDKLFSIIGHDLRGPVAGLRTVIEMVTSDVISKEDFESIVPKIQKSVVSLYDTLDNLLLWSRAQMNGFKTMPREILLANPVDTIIALFIEVAATKKIHLAPAIPPACTVFMDEDQLKIILRNLVSNAIKFTPENGSVIITAEQQHQNKTEIRICDSGVGMSAAQLEKLFTLNNTDLNTHGTHGETGAGIGLVLSKEMLEKNAGAIRVSSKAGNGTCFYVSVPTTG